jgi:YebC/PmpR family DNA-binding regulatory protein
MSGHSKWSTIKRKKGVADAKRGKIFSQLAKEITVAARSGGDPNGNPRLRTALLTARAANMPKDNVTKAIQKGTGELPGSLYEELRYEGYGPHGVAVIIDLLTDNKNRAVADVRHTLTKNGGSMAENGAVTWNFEAHGIIVVPKEGLSEDDIFEKAIDAGAEDVDTEGEAYEIVTAPAELHAVVEALEDAGVKSEEASLRMVPKTTQKVEGKAVASVLKFIDALEENEDVQNVYSNIEISDEDMAAVMAE